ncbi:MAG: site-specific integrase, partial [Alphaproteobacteria bacterium]|nr:site-specific integrase [Alphaproteobacteria bacterium]
KLANKRLSDISSDDLKLLHRKISETAGNYTGNHCIVLLRTIYNYAIKEERYDGKNPANAVKLNKKEARVRYLEHAELKRFMEALETYNNETARDVILMLLYTGVRKTNVFEMRWCDIDMDAKIWKIPQTKTDKNVTIALVEPAIELLKRRQLNADSEWVFSSAYSQSGHIVEIKRAFATIIKKANITNFRVHDLRHTLGTYLIANGADAFMVKRALTHKSLQSTQIYVNLGVEHLRDKLNDTVEKMIKISKE